jgi:ADP-ribose pyrophosphatase YjhB (NUDIX family)
VGVAVLLLEGDRLLLVKRYGSFEGMWCIPCGHVEWDEDVRPAAIREFKEETGLDVEVGPVFSVHSNFHDPEKQTVGIWFWGTLIGGSLRPGGDAAEASFFPLDALPRPMAFPTDIRICEKLRRCLGSADIALWLNSCISQE